MSFTDFPQELVDLFIDALVADRTNDKPIAALKACALTCKSLGQPARVHLFHSITITYNFGMFPPTEPIKSIEQTVNAVKALQETLVNDKQLAANVRSFQLRFRIWYTDRQEWANSAITRVTSDAQGLPGLLRALYHYHHDADADGQSTQSVLQSQLRTLRVCNVRDTFGVCQYMQWYMLHEDFRVEFEALCLGASITMFSVEGIQALDMGCILKYTKSLQTLHLTECGIGISRFWDDDLVDREEYPKLVELRIQETPLVPQLRHQMLPDWLFSSLKTLEIRSAHDEESFQYLLDLWDHCWETLETLKLVRTAFDVHMRANYKRPSFPSLRTLAIEIRTNDCVVCSNNLLWLTELLIHSTSGSLGTIRVDIITSSDALFGNYESALVEQVQKKFWDFWILKRLDEILSRPTSFSSLRTISVHIFLSDVYDSFEVPIENPFLPSHVKTIDLTSRLKATGEKLEGLKM